MQLNIALTADPELPVPPRLYGGIERIIHLLADGLVERGHRVTLFAHPDSRTKANLIPYTPSQTRSRRETIANIRIISSAARRLKFDVLHSHSRILYLAPLLMTKLPKLMSYQRYITPKSITAARRLAGDTIRFTAVSENLMQPIKHVGTWYVAYNGVPTDIYDFVEHVALDAPLAFLGRLEPIKGVHTAIEVARATDSDLIIAGNVPSGHERYFEDAIKPHLGARIRYIGPVDDVQKNELLGGCRAFLMPIEWDEPFGIVMAEAMACGTPVIGFGRGAVPEIVAHNETGFVCADTQAMIASVRNLASLDRRRCRLRVESLFSNEAVVNRFLSIYQDLISQRHV